MCFIFFNQKKQSPELPPALLGHLSKVRAPDSVGSEFSTAG
jgi:hypothetical protein